jgi:4-amino-4-deoxy-L-arabinose transferase-like glycosyltransferase
LGTYDAQLYQSLATNVSTLLRADFLGNLPHIFLGYSAYTVPLGLVYFIFGNFEPVGQLFSTVVAMGVITNLYHLAFICFNRRVAQLTAWAMTLYPYGWVLATTLNRDLPIAFCLTLFFRNLAEVQAGHRQKSRNLSYAISLGCVLYLTLLRPPLLLLCILTLSIYLLIQKRNSWASADLFRPLKVLLLLVVLLAAGGGALWAKDHLAAFRLTAQAIQFTAIDNLNQRLESSEHASSAYMQGVRYDSAQDILRTMPLATLYFMYSPLPWQVETSKQALGLVDASLLLVMTYFFWKGARRLYRRHRKFALVLFTFLIVGFCTSSLLQSNVGAAMRHRTMFFFLMAPVAVHGFLRNRQRHKTVYCSPPASSLVYSNVKENSYEKGDR